MTGGSVGVAELRERLEAKLEDFDRISDYQVEALTEYLWPFVVAAVEQAEKDTAEKIAQAIHVERIAQRWFDARHYNEGYYDALHEAERLARSAGGGTPEQGEAG